MPTLTELKQPFDQMDDQTAMAFVRALRTDRRKTKIRPAEAKAEKRKVVKKREGLVTKLAALSPEQMEMLLAKARGDND